MAQIRQQTVGNIDGAVRDAPQHHALAHARRGAVHPVGNRRQIVFRQTNTAKSMAQRQRGIAQRPGDINAVTCLRARASQRLSRRHKTMRLDGDGQRSARGIAAHELHIVFARQLEHPAAEVLKPAGIGLRQRQVQHEPGRLRAHGREIAEIYRQRLVAEGKRIGIGKEMHAGDQQVGSHRQLLAGGRLQQRGIVADAGGDIGRATSWRAKKVRISSNSFTAELRPWNARP